MTRRSFASTPGACQGMLAVHHRLALIGLLVVTAVPVLVATTLAELSSCTSSESATAFASPLHVDTARILYRAAATLTPTSRALDAPVIVSSPLLWESPCR